MPTKSCNFPGDQTNILITNNNNQHNSSKHKIVARPSTGRSYAGSTSLQLKAYLPLYKRLRIVPAILLLCKMGLSMSFCRSSLSSFPFSHWRASDCKPSSLSVHYNLIFMNYRSSKAMLEVLSKSNGLRSCILN